MSPVGVIINVFAIIILTRTFLFFITLYHAKTSYDGGSVEDLEADLKRLKEIRRKREMRK